MSKIQFPKLFYTYFFHVSCNQPSPFAIHEKGKIYPLRKNLTRDCSVMERRGPCVQLVQLMVQLTVTFKGLSGKRPVARVRRYRIRQTRYVGNSPLTLFVQLYIMIFVLLWVFVCIGKICRNLQLNGTYIDRSGQYHNWK